MADALTHPQLRHLLRRLVFTATPEYERRLSGLDAGSVFDELWSASAVASAGEPEPILPQPWRNTALAYRALETEEREVRRAAQLEAHRRQTAELRAAWLGHMIASGAPLRENLVLFFHGFFGSSSTAVEIPQALEQRNALMRSAAMTSMPALLDQLVLDPAMMIQIGMDGHGPDRVSDRPAKLILEHWTVGPGGYTDADVGELSSALTGWSLGAAEGAETVSAAELDPAASAIERRSGLNVRFDPSRHESGPKTLLGVTREFDARSALRDLALRPATARRVGRALLEYFGVVDPEQRLADRLASVYLETQGDLRTLLRTVVTSSEMWSEASRWSLIKSPVHLAVAACRQLEMANPPLSALTGWLEAAGQALFDTPNNGEGGWPGHDAWITPPDRLAIRYQLPHVLAGAPLALGLAAPSAPRAASEQQAEPEAGTDRDSTTLAAETLLDRLDPAPGLALDTLERRAARCGGTLGFAGVVMATPHYQLA